MKLLQKNTLIIVTGGPGTGKSTLAGAIMDRIEGLDLISYDRIKETDWDRFGFDNMQQKDRLNLFSLEEFYLTLQKAMWEGRTLLIEYPFCQKHKEKIRFVADEYAYRIITVLLEGDWKVIYDRGQARDQDRSQSRHPGHFAVSYHVETYGHEQAQTPLEKHLTYEEFRADIDRKNYDIQLGTTVRVDVTDISKVNFDEVTAQILAADRENSSAG